MRETDAISVEKVLPYTAEKVWRSLTSSELSRDSQKFFSPILFVEGHANKQDFTKVIKDDPMHPLEPTANWIWYKPKN